MFVVLLAKLCCGEEHSFDLNHKMSSRDWFYSILFV